MAALRNSLVKPITDVVAPKTRGPGDLKPADFVGTYRLKNAAEPHGEAYLRITQVAPDRLELRTDSSVLFDKPDQSIFDGSRVLNLDHLNQPGITVKTRGQRIAPLEDAFLPAGGTRARVDTTLQNQIEGESLIHIEVHDESWNALARMLGLKVTNDTRSELAFQLHGHELVRVETRSSEQHPEPIVIKSTFERMDDAAVAKIVAAGNDYQAIALAEQSVPAFERLFNQIWNYPPKVELAITRAIENIAQSPPEVVKYVLDMAWLKHTDFAGVIDRMAAAGVDRGLLAKYVNHVTDDATRARLQHEYGVAPPALARDLSQLAREGVKDALGERGIPLSVKRDMVFSALKNPEVIGYDIGNAISGVVGPFELRRAVVEGLPGLARQGVSKDTLMRVADDLIQITEPGEAALLKRVRDELGVRAPGDVY